MAPSYFKKAINDYATGKRQSPEMEPYSKYVLQFGLDDIADYFAVQLRKAPVKAKADAEMLSRGARLATQCAACHGAQGDGDASAQFPPSRGNRRVISKHRWICSKPIGAHSKIVSRTKSKNDVQSTAIRCACRARRVLLFIEIAASPRAIGTNAALAKLKS
jgi:cytochrome c553